MKRKINYNVTSSKEAKFFNENYFLKAYFNNISYYLQKIIYENDFLKLIEQIRNEYKVNKKSKFKTLKFLIYFFMILDYKIAFNS